MARRAVACKGWRWMPGMLVVGFARIDGVSPEGDPVRYETRPEFGDSSRSVRCVCYSGLLDDFPDLTDPATLGCLLALVREAWDDNEIVCHCVDYGPGGCRWYCSLTSGGTLCTSRHWLTEAEALVAALEAA